MTTISTSSTSSNTSYVSFFVIQVSPFTGKRSYAHDGVFLTLESARANADSQASLSASMDLGLSYEVYSGRELQALLDSGVRVYLW